jgi:hypothetical protein
VAEAFLLTDQTISSRPTTKKAAKALIAKSTWSRAPVCDSRDGTLTDRDVTPPARAGLTIAAQYRED